MNTTKNRLTGLFSILVFALSANVQSQTYSLSTPVQGVGLSIFDDQGTHLDLPLLTGTLTESVFINPGTPSIEQMGSLTLAPMSGSQTLNETRTVTISMFPNPPQTVTLTGTLTVTASFPGATIAFDSGAQALSYDGPNTYSFAGIQRCPVAIDFSWSLVTGGQTYTGSSVVGYPLVLDASGTLDTTAYPNSISITPSPSLLLDGAGTIPVGSINAANGLDITLTMVPEPSTLALGAIGAVALLLFRRGVRR